MKYFACILLSVLLFIQPALARDIIEQTIAVTTEKTGSEAKQAAFDKAVEEASFMAAQEILGPEKGLKIWPTIKAKILKNSTRYILFIKGSQPQPVAGGSQISVALRLSIASLEAVLREDGILATTEDGSVRILPLISFSDSSGLSYSWWADVAETDAVSGLSKDLFKQFQTQMVSLFKSKSVYVFDPTQPSFRLAVPGNLRGEGLRREDQSTMAQYFKADAVVSGSVRLVKIRPDSAQLRLEYDLSLWQAKTGRILTDVQRMVDLVQVDSIKATLQQTETSNAKILDEMAVKVADAISSGALNLSVVRLAINGNLSYSQMAAFKKALLDQTRELRGLKERLFEPGRATFEADSQLPGSDLVKVLANFRSPQYQVDVRDGGAQGVLLWVKVR